MRTRHDSAQCSDDIELSNNNIFILLSERALKTVRNQSVKFNKIVVECKR